MRWFVNYLRQVFCKHDFEKAEKYHESYNAYQELGKTGIRISLLCKKCAYHKTFWKF